MFRAAPRRLGSGPAMPRRLLFRLLINDDQVEAYCSARGDGEDRVTLP